MSGYQTTKVAFPCLTVHASCITFISEVKEFAAGNTMRGKSFFLWKTIQNYG